VIGRVAVTDYFSKLNHNALCMELISLFQFTTYNWQRLKNRQNPFMWPSHRQSHVYELNIRFYFILNVYCCAMISSCLL